VDWLKVQELEQVYQLEAQPQELVLALPNLLVVLPLVQVLDKLHLLEDQLLALVLVLVYQSEGLL